MLNVDVLSCGRWAIHTNPATGRTLAWVYCISVEFIHPAVAEVKCFSKSCPFQHCSLKVDLWLRLQFNSFFYTPPLLTVGHYMALYGCESWNVIRASFSFSLLSLFFPSSLPSIEVAGLSQHEQLFLTRSIFLSTLPRINSALTHPTQPINFPTQPHPALVVFRGGGGFCKLDSLSPRLSASAPPASSYIFSIF